MTTSALLFHQISIFLLQNPHSKCIITVVAICASLHISNCDIVAIYFHAMCEQINDAVILQSDLQAINWF
jgi:hypothetical protein